MKPKTRQPLPTKLQRSLQRLKADLHWLERNVSTPRDKAEVQKLKAEVQRLERDISNPPRRKTPAPAFKVPRRRSAAAQAVIAAYKEVYAPIKRD